MKSYLRSLLNIRTTKFDAHHAESPDIYGYSIEVQSIISNELAIPMEKYMVLLHSTPNFHLTSRENTEYLFAGTACYVKGAGDIMDKLGATWY